jgi:hypothetical protein
VLREDTMAKLDLPVPLLERLLASRVVPLQAKIEAIARWRDELMEVKSIDPRASELEERLSMALTSLASHVW